VTLHVSADLWTAATRALVVPPNDRERAVFLDGPRPSRDGPAVATTLVLPDATNGVGHYAISADAMSQAGRHLRRFGLLRLAQMHSHPSSWTGHSAYDDEMAYSRRDGALSIVVPYYGACAPGLAGCGVHVHDRDGWRQLTGAELASRIVIVPSFLDFRS